MMLMNITACSANGNAITYSNDTEQETSLVEIPDLRGYTFEVLTLEFERLGLDLLPIVVISDEPIDTVLSIEQMGKSVQVPAIIEIFISAGLPDLDSEDLSTPESPPPQQILETMEFGGISWLVLREEENKVLLLSEFVLFDRAYNIGPAAVTWETSTLRSYLNNEFFYTFSLEERERIAETRVINGESLYTSATTPGLSWMVPAGDDTDDRIFLLSVDEGREYFANDNARRARMADTHPLHGTSRGYKSWWLRSPSGCAFTVVIVFTAGSDAHGVRVTHNIGIRPALWLYLD